MNRTLVFALAVAVAGIVAAAAVLRARDAPYIAYAEGHRLSALDGLQRKAEAGDGFAAYLIGNAYRSGLSDGTDLDGAAGWYVSAARSGEVRAISAFIGVVANPTSNRSACNTIVALLDLTARTGDLGATVMLARYAESGICGEPDPARAADYYLGARRIDGRFGDATTSALAQLDPKERSDRRARPEKFDVAESEAIARFLAEAPALLALFRR